MMGMGPAGHVILPAIGHGMKAASDAATRRAISRLLEGVQMDSPLGRARGPLPPVRGAGPAMGRAALAGADNPYSQP
jgi:hypothetical protein